MVKRKARALTRSTKQTGKTNLKIDRKRKALAPGKRRSKKGNIYHESRRNRSDVKGVDTPRTRKQIRKLVRKKTVSKKPHIARIGKMNITITEERKRQLLSIYKKNEAKNHHRENATMLIRIFGTPAQKRRAIAIGKSHAKNRSLTQAESTWLSKNGHVHYAKILPIKKANKSKLVVRKSVIIGARRTPTGKAKLLITTREPLRGVRRHDLLPRAVRMRIPKLYSQEGKKDPMIYVKFFSPYTNYTLYVTEFDGKDTLFGYGGIGGKEWGYSSFKELVRLNRNGLPLIERDMHYGPKRFSKVRK